MNLHTPVGFYEPFDSDPTAIYANDELNAWCDACDEVLTEVGEWNDELEAYAKIKLVCDVCFFEMKKLNQGYITKSLRMEIAQLIESLPSSHQATFCALNCEKMLPSIIKFDEDEPKAAADLFSKAVALLYDFAISPAAGLDKYASLKDQIESYWPDLDESTNDSASYGFDAFVATTEALKFILSGDSAHAVNCSAAVLDTVDMYIQEVGEAEAPAPAAELEAFI